jgi:hypothetical protein
VIIAGKDDDLCLPRNESALSRKLEWMPFSKLKNSSNRWDFVNFNIIKQDNIAIAVFVPLDSVAWDKLPVCAVVIIESTSFPSPWRSPSEIHLCLRSVILKFLASKLNNHLDHFYIL